MKMKRTLTLLLASLCFSAAHGVVTTEHRVLQEKQIGSAEYEPWDDGTPLYYQFEDGWYEGNIAGFDVDKQEYKTEWSDGDIEYFTDFDVIDQMVQNYNTMVRDNTDGTCGDDAWPDGTDIWVYEDDQGWWGTVTHCQDGMYTTSWENGDVGYYPEGPAFDKMVLDAQEKTNDADATDNFDAGDVEHDFTSQTYDMGTVVYKEFEDGWYQGEIVDYNPATGMYSVEWSDGDVEMYFEGDEEMDQMVADAAQIPSESGPANFNDDATPPIQQLPQEDDDGKSGGAKFAIVLVVVVCSSVLTFFYMQRRNRAKKFAEQNSTPPEFKGDETYSDPPVVKVEEGEMS